MTRTCPMCNGTGSHDPNTPPRINRVNVARAHAALHVLWTKHAGQPGYDKSLWAELDRALDILATDGPGPVKGGPIE